jgi:DNA polymerase (family 10)
MEKKNVAKILEEIGVILDLKGENPFKTRAYYNAARIIETLNQDLNSLVNSGEIADIKGIGKALSDKITTLVRTEKLPYYEDLKASIPSGLMEILAIPGLGAKKVKVIYDKLGITSIGELEYACRENRLRDLTGFGLKSQNKILQNIELHKRYRERFLFPVAQQEAETLLIYLQKNSKIIRLALAGSLRRKRETIKDIDIVASCVDSDRNKLMEYFVNYPERESVISQGNTKSSMVLKSGLNSDLRIVRDDEFPFALHHFTGSKEHNTALRNLAQSRNIKMNEYGLFRGPKRIPCKDENEIFEKLGLQFIPPELRENMGEIEAAQSREIPALYNGDPFYGVLHIHSTYSDGANTIEEIVSECQKLGLQYVGICDHSKSAYYANGLNENRVLEQHAEIERINSNLKNFKVFKGIEVDILNDGSLDFSDDFLANFDFVIASIHSNFTLPKESMTQRLVCAIEHPRVTMLGHPTGRLLLGREPYALDMEKVISATANAGKSIELNCSPYRLDLDWRWGKLAKSRGVKIALNPDAHSIESLEDYKYGIGIAKKAWFEKQDILNTYTATELLHIFHAICS